MERTRWYKDKVFYQIWPRSFKDGNGDGMGDLYGVAEKLDYLQALGVDGIWFSPLYPSPGADCGYDISDYMDIAEEFGGMKAFDRLLEACHARGLKVIMDLVVNHTSDEHEWFQKSRQRIEPYTDYYIWRPAGKNGKLPNNWDSHFEGKAWAWDEVRKEYYMHLFAVKQPDLNMDNPLVRKEVCKILNFWLAKGVDGFREDVITFISKKEGLKSSLLPAFRGIFFYNHGPHIHEYLQEFREQALANYDCMTIAEAPLVTPKRALEYIQESPKNDIDLMIQFQCMCGNCLFTDYMPLPFLLPRLKRAFRTWQKGLSGKAWNCLYIENHDHPRVISRYGSEKFREASGKTLAVSYLFQQGTPFVYQGQELGMTNWYPDRMDLYEDVQTRNQYPRWSEKARLWISHRASRDSARTPMQWTGGKNAGFSESEPWFSVNENYREVNAEKEEKDPDSVLNFYREAIALRKSLRVVREGSYREFRKLSFRRYVYARVSAEERLLVFCSFSGKALRMRAPKGYDLSEGELVLTSAGSALKGNGFTASPYEARVYLFRNK